MTDYDADWLQNCVGGGRLPGSSSPSAGSRRLLWTGDELSLTDADLKPVDFDRLVTRDDGGMKDLLAALLRYGFAHVDGAPATMDATKGACERIFFIQKTFYGEYFLFGDLNVNQRGVIDHIFRDTAFSMLGIGAHNDGTYFISPPGFQVLHCLGRPVGTGGKNLLVDGFRVAETLRRRAPDTFDVLVRTRLDQQFLEPTRSIRSQTTVLKDVPAGGELE